MAIILLVTLGSLGDLHSFFGLGVALQKADQTVTFATTKTHLSRVELLGLKAIAVGPDFDPEDPELLKAVLNTRKGLELLHRK